MAYSQEYYQQNKERFSESAKAWRQANPEQAAEIQRKWRENHEGHTYVDNQSGYVRYIGYKHPATNPSGITFEHRIVLWDKLGGGDANCHWCDTPVTWSKKYPQHKDALVVDHLNNIKSDNRPENLVPSCQKCNFGRSENLGAPKTQIGKCDVEYCTRDKVSRGLCIGHYNQQHEGRPFAPIKENFKAIKNEEGRQCKTCEEFKPWDEFYLRTNKKTHQSECKECTKARARANKLTAAGGTK